MLARRFLPSDPADFARSIVPLGLLAVAAALPGVRWLVLVALVAGAGISIGRAAPVRWVWAAAVPISLGLAWLAWRGERFAPSGLDCTSPTSPFAVARLGEAVLVVGVLAVLALLLGASRSSLGLRLPARRYWGWAVGGFLVAGPAALVLGPFLARPFFGPVDYDIGQLGAIGPALVFAISNGVMEELAYRGALMTWSARVIGTGPALVGQAVVFGLAHSGADVLGSPALLVAAMVVGGLLAGVIALRTRSLLVPIALHVGLDIPIYYAWACAAT
jgi:membrane protease YdiL (CAAX protease family)